MEQSKTTRTALAGDEDLTSECQQLQLSLPKDGWLGRTLYLYQGFWCPSMALQPIISFQRHFKAHKTDIIVASKPKSGTTWLKALVFAIVNRTRYTNSQNPLLTHNPHELVPFFEFNIFSKNQVPDLANIPAPRLFSTHIPYASLPGCIKNSNCPIVYICRNPFDTFVSLWHFLAARRPETFRQLSIDEGFKKFYEGTIPFGSFFDHVLGFWKESLKRPHVVLFLTYEDLKEDTNFHLKRLAEFLGFPFSLEEEREGVIQEISWLCSFENLSNLEVNKTGRHEVYVQNKDYFRKGEVGDWVNHLTPSMVEQFNKLMQEKLNGSSLTFKLDKLLSECVMSK